MEGFRVTVTSKEGQTVFTDIATAFHHMQLEYKTADYLHDQQVIIVIEPCEFDLEAKIQSLETQLAAIREVVDG